MSFNFYNSFSLDKWIQNLQDDFTNIYQEKYKATQDYTLLELDKSDINYFLDKTPLELLEFLQKSHSTPFCFIRSKNILLNI